MQIKGIPFIFRILDWILTPLMWLGSGMEKGALQETHPWHIQPFSPNLIPNSKGVKIIGSDLSTFSPKNPLFHLPTLGGWKKYVVLEAKNFSRYWYVGWKGEHFDQNQKIRSQINKLRIYSPQIKILSGPKNSSATFFAFDKKGQLISIKKIAEGRIGDKKYPNLRLL